MFKLREEFQKEIFERLLKKFGSSSKAGKILKIPASSIRAYKNAYFKTVSRRIINHLIMLKILTKKELSENLLGTKNKKDIIKDCLNNGRDKRKKYFQTLRKNIPPLGELIHNKELNFSKWFYAYLPLLESNLRSLKIKEEEGILILKYNNFTQNGFKDFKVKIPSKFNLDKNFCYFFGLWCGDRSGGKRFGILNQEKQLIDFTQNFLKKVSQRPVKFLYIKQDEIEPSLSYDRKIIIKKNGKGWAISTHSTNGILVSFFYYLLENIEELLRNYLDLKIFFSGLFDAEGNVSLYNKSFRWACKNEDLVKIYSKSLKILKLYDKYDGSCLISYNKEAFYNNILPCLNHPKKINHTLFLCKGEGEIPPDFKKILDYLEKNPLKTQKEIAKALKKSKVYSELRLLKDFNFILSKGYPLRFKLKQ